MKALAFAVLLTNVTNWVSATHLQLPLIAIGVAKENETEIFEIAT